MERFLRMKMITKKALRIIDNAPTEEPECLKHGYEVGYRKGYEVGYKNGYSDRSEVGSK